MSGVISLNNIKVYAYHGCLDEETCIGGNYIVDVKIHADYFGAATNDHISETVDYCTVFDIVKREMKIPSRLIEHAAFRISSALKKEVRGIEKVLVVLTKINPPVNGDIGSVSVTAEG